MTKSTNNFKYAATLLGALAILAIAPATTKNPKPPVFNAPVLTTGTR